MKPHSSAHTGKSDADQDYRDLVTLSWTAIIPPYAFGVLSVQ